jgi:hypothetical protein
LSIFLQSGPVHCARTPVTGGAFCTGLHTCRAPRIKALTPPGQVHWNVAFAAVAAAEGAADLAFLYVGRIPLAKGYGTMGVYSVRPQQPSIEK